VVSSTTAWEQCNVTCCGTGWEYTSVAPDVAASRRAYKMCQLTPSEASLAGPHPLQLLCFNGGGSLFPACPGVPATYTIPSPPPEVGRVDVCGEALCLQPGWPALHHGRTCRLFPHFPYPITCDFWLRVLGQGILRRRLEPYGRGVTQEVAAAAGVVGVYRTAVAVAPLEVAEGEADVADPEAALVELAPRAYWVDHHVLAPAGDGTTG